MTVALKTDLLGASGFLADLGVKEVHELRIGVRVANARGPSLLKFYRVNMNCNQGSEFTRKLLQDESLW